MKRTISIFFSFIVALTIIFISCNKTEKIAAANKPCVIFKTDAERDANAATLIRLISEDDDWRTLAKINYEFLDIVVKSNIPITSDLLEFNHPALKKLNSKEYLEKFNEAKRLAANLMTKYFQNSTKCYTCETMTQAKWAAFAERVNTFRKNEEAYAQFLAKLGVGADNTASGQLAGKVPLTDYAPAPDCNNWRFTLCGGACVVTAPTVIVFAACMAMCVAEFC